jgi:nucleoid DNA-binding protein
LRPKKTKELIPQLAKELGLTEQEVKSVIDLYWDQVRKTLSSLEHNRLFLRGLGVFYIKPWALEKRLKANATKVSGYMDNPSTHGLEMMNEIFKENIKLEVVRERELEENRQKFKKRDERRNQNLEGEG